METNGNRVKILSYDSVGTEVIFSNSNFKLLELYFGKTFFQIKKLVVIDSDVLFRHIEETNYFKIKKTDFPGTGINAINPTIIQFGEIECKGIKYKCVFQMRDLYNDRSIIITERFFNVLKSIDKELLNKLLVVGENYGK